MQNDENFEFVRCIDDTESCGFLKKGQIYSVAIPYDEYMYYIEELGSYWTAERFELIEYPNKYNLYNIFKIG